MKINMCEELIKETIQFKTTDGKLYETKQSAIDHQCEILKAKKATKQLEDGLSIAQILRSVEYVGEIDPILEKVTKNSRFVISYWQCQDAPGYSPISFRTGMFVFVSGYAGLWCGPYGEHMSIEDMVRHAKHKNSIL